MSNAGPASDPWRALWFSPGHAVEAVLARPGEAGTLALVAITSVVDVGTLAADRPAILSFIALGGWAWLVVAAVALAAALVGLASLYVGGFLVNAVAHGLGGKGSQRGARAALAWGVAPTIVAGLAVIALAVASRAAGAGSPWISSLATIVEVVGDVWSIVLVVRMLARVQGFGPVRGLLSVLIGDVAVALLLAAAIWTFAFQPFDIPSGSMIPTLLVGDYVFATKYAYGYSRYSIPFAPDLFEGRVFARAPRRGDVVVFRNPRDGSDYVKRIIGMPGETVQMIDGRLSIDGAAVDRRKIEPGIALQNYDGKTIEAPTWEEILPGGRTHRIVQLQGDSGPLSNTAPFVVPPDAYFVLGDNRDNSMDSRVATANGGFGFVGLANLIGRVDRIYFSVDANDPKSPRAPRLERFGLAVE